MSTLLASNYDPIATIYANPAKKLEDVGRKLIKNDLPYGFPKQLDSELAWSGSQLSAGQFIYNLTEGDKLEIDSALISFKKLAIDGDSVNHYNFLLPNLQLKLRKLSYKLHVGIGFFLVRGLEYKKYSVEDNVIIFLGIQSFIAEERARQDHLGNMIVHIIADPTTESPPTLVSHTRHSKARISFHTDNIGDILAFQTRCIASRGGSAVLSSAYAVYNELATTRPDVICTLARPNWPIAFPFYHGRPILFYHSSHIIFNFSNEALLGSDAHPRPTSIPAIAPDQVEALEIVQSLAEKHCVKITLKVGDMHFVNNLAVFHRRDAFENDLGVKRHLVRMWLRSDSLRWDLPPVLNGPCGWGEAFNDDEERKEVWHIEPMPHHFFPLRKYPN